MIFVALGALVVAMAAVLSFGAVVRGISRSHARERAELLARIMHLAGKTWEIPPSKDTYEDAMAEHSYTYTRGDDVPPGF